MAKHDLEGVIGPIFARLTLLGYWVYSVSGGLGRRSTSQYPASVSIAGGRETRATQLMAWSTLSIERRPTTFQIDYRLAATLLKVPLRLVPTVPIIVTAATAMSAAIRPYSIAVTPASSRASFVKNTRIGFSLRFKPAQAAGNNLIKR